MENQCESSFLPVWEISTRFNPDFPYKTWGPGVRDESLAGSLAWKHNDAEDAEFRAEFPTDTTGTWRREPPGPHRAWLGVRPGWSECDVKRREKHDMENRKRSPRNGDLLKSLIAKTWWKARGSGKISLKPSLGQLHRVKSPCTIPVLRDRRVPSLRGSAVNLKPGCFKWYPKASKCLNFSRPSLCLCPSWNLFHHLCDLCPFLCCSCNTARSGMGQVCG